MSRVMNALAQCAHRAHCRGKDCARLAKALAQQRELLNTYCEGWQAAACERDALQVAFDRATVELEDLQRESARRLDTITRMQDRIEGLQQELGEMRRKYPQNDGPAPTQGVLGEPDLVVSTRDDCPF